MAKQIKWVYDHGFHIDHRQCELCEAEFLTMMDKPRGQTYTRRESGVEGVGIWRKTCRGLCGWCYARHYARGDLALVAPDS